MNLKIELNEFEFICNSNYESSCYLFIYVTKIKLKIKLILHKHVDGNNLRKEITEIWKDRNWKNIASSMQTEVAVVIFFIYKILVKLNKYFDKLLF